MKIKKYSIEERDEKLIEELTKIWRNSVEKTHLFLEKNDIESISKYVPLALKQISILIVIEEEGIELGFLGIEKDKIEMLFLHPDNIGKGFGRELLEYAKENYKITKVSVNEQNPNAIKFYEKMGFIIYERREVDDIGNSFPILDMKLK